MPNLTAKNGSGYAVWSYYRKRYSDAPPIQLWAYALLSNCGRYYETSQGVFGFASLEQAENAAHEARRVRDLKYGIRR